PVIPPHKRECGAWLILEASEFFLRMKLRVIPIRVFYPFFGRVKPSMGNRLFPTWQGKIWMKSQNKLMKEV
ncbi:MULTISPECIES: hypothetical protein, partial [Spirulina sp. CCY15215]|uniref:hypothetical protein n=1 Tax=Spirulina sp. CCY15215 TaxID=2767591 RepID=UPI00194E9AC8